MNELHLFAGAGGGILGGMLLGHTTVCAVELEPYCRKVLLQRQRDGILPKFPIWDDVTTFDGTPWRGKVDVVCGGFPCQDISAAGKGAGITGERSGLWGEMARIIGEIRPKYAFVENSPMLTLRGLDRVLGDLSEMGYDARWGVVGAYHVGAPHRRERIWITARRDKFLSYSQHNWTGWGQQQQESVEEKTGDDMANSTQLFSNGGNDNSRVGLERESFSKLGNNCGAKNVANPMCKRQSGQGSCWYASDPAEKREGETDRAWSERVGHIWGIESRLGRVADGVANRVDRLKAIGNGQVSIVAATAWRILGGE
jgi:DNA (cytosine-5)-methyltransferase 1